LGVKRNFLWPNRNHCQFGDMATTVGSCRLQSGFRSRPQRSHQ